MSVTNVDLDDQALAEAAALLGTTTKKDTINAALAEVVKRYKRRQAAERLAERGARGDFEPTRRVREARKAAQRAEAAE
ncbi:MULTISPECIES: type II toxin-antitoxin system VapB family antitoxin [unclassified Streptomyces]|jgi:Arc/MetJ family transcription regulator|uniref:type II toxin-antitoxin system VapB family antitoxin n=2 Tax=Streptomyces TaxID=1883 RepID=UPI003D918A3D